MTEIDTSGTDEMVRDPASAARGTIYGVLARLFEEPDEQLHESLSDGTLAADLDLLVERSDLGVPMPVLVTRDDYDLLCARFNDIFEVGYPEPPVPLYESEYDMDGQWNDVNLDLARAYDYFGVSIDQSSREHHDHLVLELEFAGYLARMAAATGAEDVERARKDFLDRHLAGFVASIEDAMADEVETGIYDDVVSFAASVVEADLEDLRTRLPMEGDEP